MKLLLVFLLSLPAYPIDTFLDLCQRGDLSDPLAESVGYLKLIGLKPQVETNAVPFMKIIMANGANLKEKRILRRRNSKGKWESKETLVTYDGKSPQLRRELFKLDPKHYGNEDIRVFQNKLIMEGNNRLNCPQAFSRLRDAQGLQLNTEMLLLNQGKKWVYTIPNLAPLVGLDNLEYLVIIPPANKNYGISEISDLMPLSTLRNLQWLDLRSSKVKDISPLLVLPKLEYLDLGDNQVSSIDPMAPMRSLRKLELGHNQISETIFAAGLENLRLLNLSYNKLKNIQGVEALRNLNALILSENPELKDITPATTLMALTYLSIKKTSAEWAGGKSPLVRVEK